METLSLRLPLRTVIYVRPKPCPVTVPELLTVATDSSALVQVPENDASRLRLSPTRKA